MNNNKNNFAIFGLGNPRLKYKNTRHNLGFWLLDNFLKTFQETEDINKKNENNQKFFLDKKFQSQIAKIELYNKKIILVKPQTFMNNSGQAVKAIIDYFKISLENILVVQDELDFFLGSFKFSKNSGPAGHNGIKSIIEHLGDKNFSRLRIGIAPKEKKADFSGENFVLENFLLGENEILEKIKPNLLLAIETFFKKGFETTANRFN